MTISASRPTRPWLRRPSRRCTGAGSARLIVGSRPVHTELERAIAAWKEAGAAAIFATGYHANVGVLTALARPGTVICSDELNHASIVDGCRLARAEKRVYPHGDVAALESILAGSERAIVVTETVFSMDGDIAPVSQIADVCRKHGALLVLDEAHAVLGPDPDLGHTELLRVGTLSKFLGAHGGYVAGPADLVDLIVNRARPYIFTTAAPPAIAAAAVAAVRIVVSQEGHTLKARLREYIERVSPGHPSPIIPIIVGSEREAVRTSAALLGRGILVPAIRPPSVPPGSARLRVTLSAAHTESQVDSLVDALRTPSLRWPMPDATVLVAGTHTGVGKTWVTSRAAVTLLSRGFEVVARKPVQSFEPGHTPTDAELLSAATGELPHAVCPSFRWYPRAMAPPMAATELGRPPFTVHDLVAELRLPSTGIALIEGVGGPRSPLAQDGDSVTLAEHIDPDLVLLVADAGLGVINAVRTSATALARWPLTVVFNRYDPAFKLHKLNRTWLNTCGLDIVVSIDKATDRVVRTLDLVKQGLDRSP